ncbi:MAG: winged helix-turn-helix domain-containing protein [Clostridia bacterium]|nr:winged helix-turn-helix domain-containing protein [Clostridia bacterium]
MEYRWFKLSREVFDDGVLFHDLATLAVWCYLCAHAAFKERAVVFAGKPTTLQPGQLITGRREIARVTGVDPSKVERVLHLFEEAGRIEQRTCTQNRLITVHDGLNTGIPQRKKSSSPQTERRKPTVHTAHKTEQSRPRVFSSDASYDMPDYLRCGLDKLRNYQPKNGD